MSQGALAGLKVLDFTTLLPGPYATMMLADLGAEVLRIEAPHRPDLLRMMPPMQGSVSAAHATLNRNKRSLALDLKNPRARAVVERLVAAYDIVIEQFRPGVMDRLGLGYEALKAINPRLIYCSLTGYGQTGPYKDRAGHDMNYLALAGVMSYCGRADGGPVPQGVQIADVGAGSYNSVVSILAATLHRERTGEGQAIDISMTDGAVAWGALANLQYLSGDQVPGYETEFLNGGTYYDYYRTADGRYISVGSLEPQFWQRLCAMLGREDLLPKALVRGEEMAELKRELASEFAKKTLAEWTEIFDTADACVEPVLTVEEMAAHPLTQARGMIAQIEDADGNTMRQTGSPFKLSATPPRLRRAGGPVGEHTREVLAEAGYSTDEIEEMAAGKVFG